MKRNNVTRTPLVRILLAGFLSVMIGSACSMAEEIAEDIVDLSRLEVTTVPSGTDVLVPAAQREFFVEFSRPVDMPAAEEAVSLASPEGPVAYDKRWDKQRLMLAPVEPLRPGTRYVLACRGTVSAPGGLVWETNTECSFHVATADKPPVLRSFSPDPDSSVSGTEPVVLRFNAAINTTNPDRHITVLPDHPVTISARDQDHTLVITPDRPWSGLTRYRWTVLETLEGASGVRVYRAYAGSFRTLEDTTAPEKPDLYSRPIDPPGGIRLPPESLMNGYGLEFRFTEPVLPDSFTRKLAISPAVTTCIRQLDPAGFLVHPDDGTWTAGEAYTITIDKGLEDLCGNKTTEAFIFTVTADIPVLSVVRLAPDTPVPEGPPFITGEDMQPGSRIYSVAIDTLTNCPLSLTLTLSVPLSREEAQRLVSAISLEPLFPRYVAQPEEGPVLFSQTADPQSLRITWYGLEVPSRDIDEERVLYTFSIRGGSAGFRTDTGSFFPDSPSVIIETREKEVEP